MKTGLVLSGGAAWGLANIGVLEVFEKERIAFDCIAGSSMGAIVAGVYALGVPIHTFSVVAKKLSMRDVARAHKHMLQGGLHGGLLKQELRKHLSPIIGSATIGDCQIPFLCVAGRVKRPIHWERIVQAGFTDHFLDAIEPYIFPKDTLLMDAFLATTAIPVVFSPAMVKEDTFVDLVHFGAIPVGALRQKYKPDIVIATDTNPRYEKISKFLPKSWSEFIEAGQREIEKEKRSADLVVQPKMSLATFRFDRAEEFIRAGRVEAKNMLPKIRKILDVK